MADILSSLRTAGMDGQPDITSGMTTTPLLDRQQLYNATSPDENSLMRGARYGAANLTAGDYAQRALSEEASGDPSYKQDLSYAQQNQNQAQMYAPRVSSLRDIHGVGDALDYAGAQVGSGAVSMAPLIAGGLLTRNPYARTLSTLAGTLYPAFREAKGGIALEQYNDPELAAKSAADRNAVANISAGVGAGAGALVPTSIASKFLTQPTRSFLGNAAREALVAGAASAIQEGATETGNAALTGDSSRIDLGNIGEAAVGGGLTGGVVGAAGHLPSHLINAPIGGAVDAVKGLLPGRDQGGSGPADGATPEAPGPTPDAGGAAPAPNKIDDLKAKAQSGLDSARDMVSGTIDRMKSAVSDSANPRDFLNNVFRSSKDDAAADLVPDHEDPGILNADNTEEAIGARDTGKVSRASSYAEELLNDEKTPQEVKDNIKAMGGDFSDPQDQHYVAWNLTAQRGAEKIQSAVSKLKDLFDANMSRGKDLGDSIASKISGGDGNEDFAAALAVSKDRLSKFAQSAKGAIGDVVSAAQDKIVKKNLQSISDEHIAPLVDALSQKLGPSASEAPDLARALIAASVRIDPSARITPDVARALGTLHGAVDDHIIDQVSAISGSEGLRTALARIRDIPSASQDVRKGNSFFESMLADKNLDPSVKNNLADFVDDASLKVGSLSEGKRTQVLGGLAAAFGSPERAKTVLDYYGKMRREAFSREADRRFIPEDREPTENDLGYHDLARKAPSDSDATAASKAEYGALTEGDGPKTQYGFREAATERPFRKFAGEMLSDGKMRREGVRALMNDRSKNGDSDVKLVPYSEYLGAGVDHEAALNRVYKDIDKRITEHEAKQNSATNPEDRSKQINVLKGERDLLERVHRDGGPRAALDQYEVLAKSERAPSLTASDKDLRAMKTAVRTAPETAVEFTKTDGTKLKLSAESIWKTMALKDRDSETLNSPNKQTIAQMFRDGVASVLARDDIARVENLDKATKLVVDRSSGEKAVRSPKHPDRVAALSAFEKARDEAGKGVPARRAFLRDQLSKFESGLDEAASSDSHFDFEHFADVHENTAAEQVVKAKRIFNDAQRAVDEAKDRGEPKTAIYNKMTARDYARGALDDYINHEKEIKSQLFETRRERDEAEKSGVPENESEEGRGFDAQVEREKNALERTKRDALEWKRLGKDESGDFNAKSKKQSLADYDVRRNEDGTFTARKTESFTGSYGEDNLRQSDLGTAKTETAALRLAQEHEAALPKGFNPDNGPFLPKDKLNKQSAMNQGEGEVKRTTPEKISAEIARTRGKDVAVEFSKFADLGASGEHEMNADKTQRVIRIAMDSVNPMGVAWHESLHDFFGMLDENTAHRAIKRDLVDASNAPHVSRQLNDLLSEHPEALKQIKESPEERVAYMYQFWADGALKLNNRAEGMFAKLKDFFKNVLGIVGKDTRAENLLTALHEGKFADPNVVSEVLSDENAANGDRLRNKFERAQPALQATLSKVVNTAPDRLRGFQNEHIAKIADMFSSEQGKLGFIQRRFQQQGIWENKLAEILKGSTAVDRRTALDNLQSLKNPNGALETKLRGFLSDMYGYMSQSNVATFDKASNKWEPLRQVKDYFPRVWDRDAVTKNAASFIELLKSEGGLTDKAAKDTVKAIQTGLGQLDLAGNEHALGYTPFANHAIERQFKFINASNADKFSAFQNKDMADVMTGYVKQAVHRAEYSKAFGNDGEVINDLVQKSGIKDPEELRQIKAATQALEGSLGSNMNPKMKEFMSSAMTLQNLVTMPMAIFSQMVDPVVLAARSGELKDAGIAYINALKALRGKKIDGEDMAKMLGIISQDSVLSAMGNSYGSQYMGKKVREINRVFFKYNGMQGWNDAMRISATAAGERYLIANKGNEKALDELGLKSSDIRVGKDGRLDVSSPQMKEAMFRFVDEAVLRPSASQRPVWMSDPRFMLVAHLKQFTYAMQHVVLKRASRELADGNAKPWATLLLTMPTILAADMAKFAMTGGVPTNWGLKDYIAHSVSRSGLLGLGDFGVQATRGVSSGKMPGEGLLGPTWENLMTILRYVGGDHNTQLKDVFDRTVPGARFT